MIASTQDNRPLGHETYRFGAFRLDPINRGLYMGESIVRLAPRVFDVIQYFVEHSSTIVKKDELAHHIWGDSAVGDDNISQHIFLARKALGDLERPHQYIVTVHGEGFRFAPEVESTSGYVRAALKHDFGEVERYTAEHLYRSGRHFLDLRIESGNASAIDFFERAIETRPDTAEAYAGLAEAYWFRAHSFYGNPRESFIRALEFANRAIEINSECPEALVIQGAIRFFFSHDSVAAFKWLETASAIGATSLHLPLLQIQIACARGEHERASLMAMEAMRRYPGSPEIALQLGVALYFARDYETAAKHIKGVLSLDPNLMFGRFYLGLCHLMLRDFDEARIQLARAMQPELTIVPRALWPVQQPAVAALSLLESYCGNRQRAQELANWLSETSSLRERSSYAQALCFLGLRNSGNCYEALGGAIAQGDPWVAFLLTDPLFDDIREQERFVDLVQAVLLPKR